MNQYESGGLSLVFLETQLLYKINRLNLGFYHLIKHIYQYGKQCLQPNVVFIGI